MKQFLITKTAIDFELKEFGFAVVGAYSDRKKAERALKLFEQEREDAIKEFYQKAKEASVANASAAESLRTADLAVSHWQATFNSGFSAGLPETKAKLEEAVKRARLHHKNIQFVEVEDNWKDRNAEYAIQVLED
jgi:hypothetical protein